MNECPNTINRTCAGRCPDSLPTERTIARTEEPIDKAISIAVSDVMEDTEQVELSVAILEKSQYSAALEPRLAFESSTTYVRRCMGIMATNLRSATDYYQGSVDKYTAGCDGPDETTIPPRCNSINKETVRLPFE